MYHIVYYEYKLQNYMCIYVHMPLNTYGYINYIKSTFYLNICLRMQYDIG